MEVTVTSLVACEVALAGDSDVDNLLAVDSLEVDLGSVLLITIC